MKKDKEETGIYIKFDKTEAELLSILRMRYQRITTRRLVLKDVFKAGLNSVRFNLDMLEK